LWTAHEEGRVALYQFVHLHIACGKLKEGQEDLAIATQIVSDMGYQRRDPEIPTLQRMLNLDETFLRSR
jgi:hypothetical protein